MPGWLWILIVGVGALLGLALIGYLLGPQNGKALTKRDQRMLDRRSSADLNYLQSASHEEDVAMMAEGTMDLARDHNASGIPATESLVLALEKMEHFERMRGNRAGLGPWLVQITGFLMEAGVLNPMDPARIEAQLPGFSPAMLRQDPGVIVRVTGVRDLHAWPATAAPVIKSKPTVVPERRSKPDTHPRPTQGKPPTKPRSDYEKTQAVALPAFPQRQEEWFANLITVIGPASSGKTLVACNLAAMLASIGKSVALFDCDLQFGDVGGVIGCDPPTFSTLDLSTTETANTELKRVLPTPRDGLWVVPGVSDPSLADSISIEGLVQGVAAAASEFDIVIIDSSPFLDEPIITLVEKSGLTLVIDRGENPRQVRLTLDTLSLLKYRDQCLMVRNGPESPSLGDPGPARYEAVPAWPILAQDESIHKGHRSSLLVVDHVPNSPLAEQFAAFADAIVKRLDP